MSRAQEVFNGAQPPCLHCTFGLIVTGEGERDFLPSLFRTLMERAGCTFRVLRRIGQRSPITAPRRQRELQIVGTSKKVLPRDVEDFGLVTRTFLKEEPCHFVLLIDDAEGARRHLLPEIYARYRDSMDAVLAPLDLKARASVHFMTNMIEAYHFAHAAAVNSALGANVLPGDHVGDVEGIGHPKGDLKRLFEGFDEKRHGGEIIRRLDLDHVLSDPNACAYLRALFAWCVRVLSQYCPIYDAALGSHFRILDGSQAELTRHQ